MWHMEVPSLGVQSELQLLTYATATATQDPSHAATSVTYATAHCNVGSLTHWVRSGINFYILMDSSQVGYHWAMKGTPAITFLMLHICSYFSSFGALKRMSKTPIFFQDLELANFSFNTSRLWIVPFPKGVTLPVTDYTSLLRNNSINTFFQHHCNWLSPPPFFLSTAMVLAGCCSWLSAGVWSLTQTCL